MSLRRTQTHDDLCIHWLHLFKLKIFQILKDYNNYADQFSTEHNRFRYSEIKFKFDLMSTRLFYIFLLFNMKARIPAIEANAQEIYIRIIPLEISLKSGAREAKTSYRLFL